MNGDLNKPIDVLMLTYWDWANTGYRFAKMARDHLGLNVIQYKGQPHRFGYPEQAEIHPELTRGRLVLDHPLILQVEKGEIAGLMERAKVIHFTASTIVEAGTAAPNARKVIQHGGTTYRRKPEQVNRICNPWADAAVIQCPDLYGLGAKNEHLIYYPVDTDTIYPRDFERVEPGALTVGHWPSSTESKGTELIYGVIQDLQNDPRYKDRLRYAGIDGATGPVNLPWEKHLARVRGVDVLIETVQPTFTGKTFGEWGNQCLEGCAMGKVVITNSLAHELYEREYGTHSAFIRANDADELREGLIRCLEMTDRELKMKKERCQVWAVEFHSMKATAERLWKRVYEPLGVF